MTETVPRPRVSAGGRLTRDTLIYVAGTIATGPIGIITAAVLTRFLAPDKYGQLAVLFVFAGFLTTLYNVGTLHGTFLWVYGTTGGDAGMDLDVGSDTRAQVAAQRRALGTGVLMTLAIVSAGTLICFALAHPLSLLLTHTSNRASEVRLAAISGATGSLFRLTVNVFRFERRPRTFGIANASRPVIVVALTIPLVVLGAGTDGALIGTSVGSLVSSFICVALGRRSYALLFSTEDALQIIKRGALVVIPVLSLYVVHNTDVFFLSRFAPSTHVAIYRLASRFAMLPSYFASGFLMAWSPLERTPAFAAAYKHSGRRPIQSSFVTYYVIVSLTLVVALGLASNALVLIAPASYVQATPLIPLIALGFVLYGGYIVLLRTAGLKNQIRIYSLTAVGCAAAYALLNILLIGPLGSYGPAAALILAMASGCAVLAVMATRTDDPLPFEWQRIFAATLVAGGVFACAYPSRLLGPIAQGVVSVVASVAYLPLLVATGAVPRSQLRGLLAVVRHALPPRVSRASLSRSVERLPPVMRQAIQRLVLSEEPFLPVHTGGSHETSELPYFRLVQGLRQIGGIGSPSPLDGRVGRYMLSNEPEARRDHDVDTLIKEGFDPLEFDRLQQTLTLVRKLRRKNRWWHRRNPVDRAQSVDALSTDARELLTSAILQREDPLQTAERLGISQPLVYARTVRALRHIGHIGSPGENDAALGHSLLEGRRRVWLGRSQAQALLRVASRIRRELARR